MASQRAKEYKAKHYPDHDLMTNSMGSSADKTVEENRNSRRFTPENLERDYWDIVESHEKEMVVEYGKPMDCFWLSLSLLVLC